MCMEAVNERYVGAAAATLPSDDRQVSGVVRSEDGWYIERTDFTGHQVWYFLADPAWQVVTCDTVRCIPSGADGRLRCIWEGANCGEVLSSSGPH